MPSWCDGIPWKALRASPYPRQSPTPEGSRSRPASAPAAHRGRKLGKRPDSSVRSTSAIRPPIKRPNTVGNHGEQVRKAMAQAATVDAQDREDEERAFNSLAQQHAREMQKAEEMHNAELEKIRKACKVRMKDFKVETKRLMKTLDERQTIEKGAIGVTLEEGLWPQKPKYSGKVLDMRRAEQVLIRRKKFDEALKIAEKGDEIEKLEYDEWAQDRAERIFRRQTNHGTSLALERKGLERRIEAARHRLSKAVEKEIKTAENRFVYERRVLAHQQQMILLRMQQYPKSWIAELAQRDRSKGAATTSCNASNASARSASSPAAVAERGAGAPDPSRDAGASDPSCNDLLCKDLSRIALSRNDLPSN